ncbi:transcriptional regulator [Gordonia sp. ABSL1-1]|uniref:helix-turn-helix transcriptional regulator n=1 Tax=Gordonia sp. ABSL1-1 TaxID=3053923 RepID=UPI002572D859|nr:metalloregulator ArsR/SmtB family transcription factor [Gordonia sp. ABSL1-1]MDL9935830.1 transcriptional regulator [Gordonia sp. ABSL1-1]
MSNSAENAAADPGAAINHDGQTRAAVVTLLVEDGPLTAGEIAERLGISAAGVRRHLEALVDAGDVETSSSGFGQRGRGRPAKWFQLTARGRGKLRHAYDDLAGAAMRKLRDVAGEDAVYEFARERVERIVAGVEPSDGTGDVAATVGQIADALTVAGYSANTREVGTGVQICQHHCPVAHVATEFPELCEAETEVFTELLGTHVQRLATIANGDCACTTHVPLHPAMPPVGGAPTPGPDTGTDQHDRPERDTQPASARLPKPQQGTTRKVSR